MMNEDLIARLRAIRVPTKEEIFARSREPYGLLFGCDWSLQYLDFESGRVKEMAKSGKAVYPICVHDGDVFYGSSTMHVRSLSGKAIKSWGYTLLSYKGRLLLGAGDIRDVMNGEMLASASKLHDDDISSVISLFTSPRGDLYALVQGSYEDHSIYAVSDDFSLDERVLYYSEWHDRISRAVAVPYGSFKGYNGKNYDFSILSCVNLDYLDVNGEEIEGTEIGDNREIHDLAVLGHSGSEVDVVYSGPYVSSIMRARIDLEKREVIGNVEEINHPTNGVYGLEPVRDYDLHEKLMGFGPDE